MKSLAIFFTALTAVNATVLDRSETHTHGTDLSFPESDNFD
jgi:hypothetical protein